MQVQPYKRTPYFLSLLSVIVLWVTERVQLYVCSFVSEWLSFSVQLFCSIFNPHQCLPALSSYPQQQVNGFWRAIDKAVCESSSHAAWQHWAPGIVKLSRKPLSAEGPCFHSLCPFFFSSACVGAVLVAYSTQQYHTSCSLPMVQWFNLRLMYVVV